MSAGEPSPNPQPSLIEEAVRERDRPGWLATLFAPAPARPALLALAAYRVELERVVAAARDPLAAELRLKWWCEAVRDEGYGAGPSTALVATLREGLARYGWPADTLCAMSEAHVHELYADPFPDWDAFDGHAGETRGAEMQLGAMALGVEALGPSQGQAAARTAATAAGYGAVALSAAAAARDFSARFANGHTRLPAAAWGEISPIPLPEALGRGSAPPEAKASVAALIAHGERADSEMRAHLAAIHPAVRAAMLPAMLSRLRLASLRRGRTPAPWRVQLALWRAARFLRRLPASPRSFLPSGRYGA